MAPRPSTPISNDERDKILMYHLVYEMNASDIGKTIGRSGQAANAVLRVYFAVKDKDWDSLATAFKSNSTGVDTITWAEKVTKNIVPKNVMDAITKPPAIKPEPEKAPASQNPAPDVETKLDTIIAQNQVIVANIKALEQDMPQMLTAITYLSKTLKETVTQQFDRLMPYVKTIDESLKTIKCNTRKGGGTNGVGNLQ